VQNWMRCVLHIMCGGEDLHAGADADVVANHKPTGAM
jgi:hypothetical protein